MLTNKCVASMLEWCIYLRRSERYKFGWKGLSVESAAHIQSELFTENTSHVRRVG